MNAVLEHIPTEEAIRLAREMVTDQQRFMLSGVFRVRQGAPRVSWPLVTELLHPIGKTCFLGY